MVCGKTQNALVVIVGEVIQLAPICLFTFSVFVVVVVVVVNALIK